MSYFHFEENNPGMPCKFSLPWCDLKSTTRRTLNARNQFNAVAINTDKAESQVGDKLHQVLRGTADANSKVKPDLGTVGIIQLKLAARDWCYLCLSPINNLRFINSHP